MDYLHIIPKQILKCFSSVNWGNAAENNLGFEHLKYHCPKKEKMVLLVNSNSTLVEGSISAVIGNSLTP